MPRHCLHNHQSIESTASARLIASQPNKLCLLQQHPSQSATMARTLVFGLVTLCLLQACAGITTTELQEWANNVTLTVAKVQNSVPNIYWSRMDNIALRINDLTGQFYQIDDWNDPQSEFDLLVELANVAVGDIKKVLTPSFPTTGKPPIEWGSRNPYVDLEAVGKSICSQISALQAYAEARYSVILTNSSLSACGGNDSVSSQSVPADDEEDFAFADAANATEAAEAPAPAQSRRLLMI